MSRLALAVLFSGLFVCVLSAQVSIRPNSKCSGYTLYKDAGFYLMYHEMPVTFDDAKKRCAKEGGVLASPLNDEIKAAMMNILSKTWNIKKHVFTGFSAEPHNGGIFSSIEGVWLSSVEHTWALDDPNNGDGSENCIALSPNGMMSDVNCNHLYPYLCFLSEVKVKTMGVCSGNIAGYAALENTTGSCYKLHSDKLSFYEAVKVCEQEGGHLIIINGDNEAQAAASLLVKNNDTYTHVGIQLNKNPRKWMTLQGETIADAGYAKWVSWSGHDSAPEMSSVALYYEDGLFYSTSPSTTHPFICEKDAEIVVCE